MSSTQHSLYSSYREMLLEHLFAGEVMRNVWLSGTKRLEIMKPQVDDGGYDLVLEARGVVRHVQLKATFAGSTIKRFNVQTALGAKPSGCVVCLHFNPDTLELGPFFWFGGRPGEPLPSLDGYPVAKHTKGDSQGVKGLRPNHRVLPLSRFEREVTVASVVERLFGPCPADES